MTTRLLTSRDLVGSPKSLDGKRFAIQGLLIVKGESLWIDFKNGDYASHLEVGDDDLIERLLDAVPCYLGGEYLYRDPVNLICILEAKEGSGVRISHVESVELTRDGATFAF